MFSGCLGDKIVGTWKSADSSATITFNKDKTFSYNGALGILGLKGTWEKTNGSYVLYSEGGTRLGTAAFEKKDLRVTVGGAISISGLFVKQ